MNDGFGFQKVIKNDKKFENENRLLKKHVFVKHKRTASLYTNKVTQNDEFLKEKNRNAINQNSSGIIFTIQEKSEETQSSVQ